MDQYKVWHHIMSAKKEPSDQRASNTQNKSKEPSIRWFTTDTFGYNWLNAEALVTLPQLDRDTKRCPPTQLLVDDQGESSSPSNQKKNMR